MRLVLASLDLDKEFRVKTNATGEVLSIKYSNEL